MRPISIKAISRPRRTASARKKGCASGKKCKPVGGMMPLCSRSLGLFLSHCGAGADEAHECLLPKGFLLKQRLRQLVEGLARLHQQLMRIRMALCEQTLDLLVNTCGRGLAIVPPLGQLVTQER